MPEHKNGGIRRCRRCSRLGGGSLGV